MSAFNGGRDFIIAVLKQFNMFFRLHARAHVLARCWFSFVSVQ